MPPLQPVPVQLDIPRTLRLDLNAVMRAEMKIAELTGVPGVSLLVKMRNQEIGFVDTACLLWAGLLHESPTLKFEQAVQLCQATELNPLSEAIGRAFELHMGVKKRQKESNEGTAGGPEPDPSGAAQTGGFSSGPSDAVTSDSPTPSSGS